jgi:hypothetical protein
MRGSLARKIVAGGMLGLFLTMATACYGPFNLTRNVYHWNSGVKGSGEVNDKWMREFVFFGMIVVPVYMFSALLDAFVFNSIQFWTGENPVKASGLDPQSHVAQIGDMTIRWTARHDGATVSYERGGVVERQAVIVPSPSGYRLMDQGGVTLAESKIDADGAVTLLDREGRPVRAWSPEQLARFVGNNEN